MPWVNEKYVVEESEVKENTIDVPYSVQKAALEAMVGPNGLIAVIRFLIENWLDITAAARQRLDEGYPQFGSEMYRWDRERRRYEIITELADTVNYLSSGDV